MKKKLVFLLLMCCTMLPFTSCSSSDDDPTIAKDVVGTYNGPMGITINGASAGDPTDCNILIAASSDKSKVKLSIANFSFGSVPLGTIAIDGCSCTYANGKFTLNGASPVTVNLGGSDITCPTTVTGTVSDDKVTLSLTINVPGLNQSVVVTYTGTRQQNYSIG